MLSCSHVVVGINTLHAVPDLHSLCSLHVMTVLTRSPFSFLGPSCSSARFFGSRSCGGNGTGNSGRLAPSCCTIQLYNIVFRKLCRLTKWFDRYPSYKALLSVPWRLSNERKNDIYNHQLRVLLGAGRNFFLPRLGTASLTKCTTQWARSQTSKENYQRIIAGVRLQSLRRDEEVRLIDDRPAPVVSVGDGNEIEKEPSAQISGTTRERVTGTANVIFQKDKFREGVLNIAEICLEAQRQSKSGVSLGPGGIIEAAFCAVRHLSRLKKYADLDSTNAENNTTPSEPQLTNPYLWENRESQDRWRKALRVPCDLDSLYQSIKPGMLLVAHPLLTGIWSRCVILITASPVSTARYLNASSSDGSRRRRTLQATRNSRSCGDNPQSYEENRPFTQSVSDSTRRSRRKQTDYNNHSLLLRASMQHQFATVGFILNKALPPTRLLSTYGNSTDEHGQSVSEHCRDSTNGQHLDTSLRECDLDFLSTWQDLTVGLLRRCNSVKRGCHLDTDSRDRCRKTESGAFGTVSPTIDLSDIPYQSQVKQRHTSSLAGRRSTKYCLRTSKYSGNHRIINSDDSSVVNSFDDNTKGDEIYRESREQRGVASDVTRNVTSWGDHPLPLKQDTDTGSRDSNRAQVGRKSQSFKSLLKLIRAHVNQIRKTTWSIPEKNQEAQEHGTSVSTTSDCSNPLKPCGQPVSAFSFGGPVDGFSIFHNQSSVAKSTLIDGLLYSGFSSKWCSLLENTDSDLMDNRDENRMTEKPQLSHYSPDNMRVTASSSCNDKATSDRIRRVVGHCSWTYPQLLQEIRKGSWIPVSIGDPSVMQEILWGHEQSAATPISNVSNSTVSFSHQGHMRFNEVLWHKILSALGDNYQDLSRLPLDVVETFLFDALRRLRHIDRTNIEGMLREMQSGNEGRKHLDSDSRSASDWTRPAGRLGGAYEPTDDPEEMSRHPAAARRGRKGALDDLLFGQKNNNRNLVAPRGARRSRFRTVVTWWLNEDSDSDNSGTDRD
eukprot:GHVQ01033214.1.p1 GENE.GHVQ01033214.1~~GHVQ01033214.1.p1  ORF type:complete len:1001 (+),score=79.95 GHVQ01033214.1:150-3152(+)